ncbi:hypothetical protein PGB28_08540 [Primorskyibacter aestuariivivens]|uniref:hypothetical protein n=1 Tax=Primorskyibacter aestuariivivens TaxID=1888912 RepID=UPI00230197F5|nr:hypothetical protein [Primorskyibacter aestuariivivens]MDA7428506.1 hypothetical protein [Primorskyibacter aestuariivivens]
MNRIAALVLSLWAGVASAQEFIAVDGPLSDDAFYRLVSCAAPPGKPCQKPVVTWPKFTALDLTIGITRVDPGFSAADIDAYEAALGHSIAQINTAGAAIRLRKSRLDPDIAILLLDIEQGGEILGSGIPGLDGIQIDAAWVHLWWNGNHHIQRGAIVFSPGLQGIVRRSTVMEEVFQATGLLTDIENAWYTDRSIVSQNGFQRTTLGVQDIMALRRHYP